MVETPSLFGDTSLTSSSQAGGYTPEFEEVWKAYPGRRIGKKACFKCCNTRIRQGATWEKLKAAAEAYAKECSDREPQFIKHGATFFGDKEWWADYANRNPELSELMKDAPWNTDEDDGIDYGLEVPEDE